MKTENIIDGVIILKQESIMQSTPVSTMFILCGIIVMIVSVIIFLIKTRNVIYLDPNDKRIKQVFLGVIIGAIIALLATIKIPLFCEETGRYKYECTFNDTVTANEITDNFNIISVSDNVWIIEDKEVNHE